MSSNSGEVFCGGATTSQHVDADDDDHFQNTTFKLKRTRSLGLLDEFIDSEQQEKEIEKKNQERERKRIEESEKTDVNSDVSRDSSNANESTSPVPTVNSAFITSPDIHDDSELVAEPSRLVDYLSHQWDVSDISKSWRYVISRRKNVANAARLENASWRTWAQRRSNLKTISPEKVNWYKEIDVTWLYGPIVNDDDHDNENEAAPEDSRSFNTASSVVAGDISIARKTHAPKPILKKRTVEDMMISHSNLLKLEIATARAEHEQSRREDAAAQARRDAIEKSGSERPPEYFDYDVISAKLNSQYKNMSGPNSANSSSLNLAGNRKSLSDLTKEAQSVASETPSHSGNDSAVTHSSLHRKDSAVSSVKEKRRIHFNDEVQQCIIIDFDDDEYDEYEDDDNDYDYEGDDNYLYESYNSDSVDDASSYHDEEDEDDDDEGGFFLNVRSPSSARLAGALPGLSSQNKQTQKDADDEHSDIQSTTSSKSFKSIQLLPPTTLNYGSDDEDSDDCNPYTSSISHNVDSNSSRGYDYYYDYNTVYQVDANHAIYGDNSKNKTPDVVDVPENITVGSNFDYEIIENEDVDAMSGVSPEIVGNAIQSPVSTNIENKERLPISSLDDSGARKDKKNLFSFDGSDSEDSSESDDDDGALSISARNSSQSLAQSVFGQPMTSMNQEESHYPQHITEDPEPEAKHISSINPNHSSTGLSKQPHSSNSLSGQFFGGTMTKTDDDKSLSRSFFNLNSENSAPQPTRTQSFTGAQTPPVSKKATALPPHTTSAYAFSGGKNTGGPVKSSFIFESESDSDEEIENEEQSSSTADSENNRTSYSSLYEVAGRNGITVPNTEGEENNRAKKGSTMTNFLGSWNKGNSS